MNQRFDDEILRRFANGFYGYGNPTADIWFVGMEEGGGNTYSEITARLSAWHHRGQREFEDLRDFHHAFGEAELFGEQARLQPTWRKLIRILLGYAGSEYPTTEEAREYQRSKLGRAEGESCLLELLPLPSPRISNWCYARHSSLPELRDRGIYLNHFAERRCAQIGKMIAAHEPKAVVFYGLRYLKYWETISGKKLERGRFVRGGHSGGTGPIYLAVAHPSSRGTRNEDFSRIGVELSAFTKR